MIIKYNGPVDIFLYYLNRIIIGLHVLSSHEYYFLNYKNNISESCFVDFPCYVKIWLYVTIIWAKHVCSVAWKKWKLISRLNAHIYLIPTSFWGWKIIVTQWSVEQKNVLQKNILVYTSWKNLLASALGFTAIIKDWTIINCSLFLWVKLGHLYYLERNRTSISISIITLKKHTNCIL